MYLGIKIYNINRKNLIVNTTPRTCAKFEIWRAKINRHKRSRNERLGFPLCVGNKNNPPDYVISAVGKLNRINWRFRAK